MRDGHQFHPTVLREYDIRGIVGKTLTAADARAIGRSFGTMVAAAAASGSCVGYDGRLSSPALADGLVEGLAAGLDVLSDRPGADADAVFRRPPPAGPTAAS